MELDYEKDMYTDETALDVEWLHQANLARKYGKHVAELRKQVNKLEEKKKTIRAELIQYANRNPIEACGKEKPNAADIESYYRSQNEYKQVVNDLLDAQYELEYAEVAKNEIAFTRKATLENLVKLHGQQYFAGPSIPRDLSQERMKKEKQKEVNNKIRVKRK